MRTLTKELRDKITPAEAIKILKAGNERFVNNLKVNRNLLQQVNETSEGQHPFAVVISCMDSRTTPELIFDQGLGDVFSIRIAGNVITEEILGSAEYGCKVAGAKAIIILGHSGCGAVKGAVDDVELGHLHFITKKIQRCIPEIRTRNPTSTTGDLCQAVTEKNVLQGITDIHKGSAILSTMSDAGEICIVGGVYDISTGKVKILEETEKYWTRDTASESALNL